MDSNPYGTPHLPDNEASEEEKVGSDVDDDDLLPDPQNDMFEDEDNEVIDDDAKYELTVAMVTKESLDLVHNNIECLVCKKLLVPIEGHSREATECVECEVGICASCQGVQCPSCGTAQAFRKRLTKLRVNELSNLMFKCPNSMSQFCEKQTSAMKYLEAFEHIPKCLEDKDQAMNCPHCQNDKQGEKRFKLIKK